MELLVQLGMLGDKHDLDWHSEAIPPGVIPLSRQGVINGKHKTLHQGKVVVTFIGVVPEGKWSGSSSYYYPPTSSLSLSERA